jgi:hypothetical protein
MMSPRDPLSATNLALAELLGAATPAELTPPHDADDLMVWFVFGGKDVGKSSLLNATLGGPISVDRDEAEGTSQFVAYVHSGARDELAARLTGLDVRVQYQPHDNESLRRVCLIDGPDFDSRLPRHAEQVRAVIAAGAVDGALLLTSHAKYKDRHYWQTVNALAGLLSPSHLIFVMTKADEIVRHEADFRDDFATTIRRRLGENGEPPTVYLVDSLDRGVDFPLLQKRLLRSWSDHAVHQAQTANRGHAHRRASEALTQHYALDRVAGALTTVAGDENLEDVFDRNFPDVYFHTIAERLTADADLIATVRRHAARRPEKTLAGLAAISGAFRWLASLGPGWFRREESTTSDAAPSAQPSLWRWGRESLNERLARAQREAFGPIPFDDPDTVAAHLAVAADVEADLAQLLADHAARPTPPALPTWLRLLLNVPVYLYLLIAIFVLLFPAFLMLDAWDIWRAPELARVLTPASLKVSMMGFGLYYVMAVLFAMRRKRERSRTAVDNVVADFMATAGEVLRVETAHPLLDFQARFDRLRATLDDPAKSV